jgi:AcrR family transcriptional regulator
MSTNEAATGLRKRQRRMRRNLTARARALTAERGLGGFTLQELCDEVGLSRRSFFNYFPSKDAVVLGLADETDRDHLDGFAAARAASGNVGSDELIDDLVALTISQFESAGPTADEMATLLLALKREPKLIGTLIEAMDETQNRLVSFLAEHAGLAGDVNVAQVVVAVLSSLVKLSADDFFREGNTISFRTILEQRVRTARTLFTSSAPVPSRSETLVTVA